MKNSLISMDKWPASLPLEIAHYESAIGVPLYSLDEIADHFGISVDTIDRYRELPAFRAEVRSSLAELKDTNSLIRRKVRKQAELYFDSFVPKWLNDPDFPPAEKVKLLTLLAKTARVIDDPADKARAEAEAAKALPQQVQPVLNLILTAAPGTTVGAVIPQQAERVINEQ